MRYVRICKIISITHKKLHFIMRSFKYNFVNLIICQPKVLWTSVIILWWNRLFYFNFFHCWSFALLNFLRNVTEILFKACSSYCSLRILFPNEFSSSYRILTNFNITYNFTTRLPINFWYFVQFNEYFKIKYRNKLITSPFQTTRECSGKLHRNVWSTDW